MQFKVVYFWGEFSLKLKASSGFLSLNADSFLVEPDGKTVLYSEIIELSQRRLSGLGTVIWIKLAEDTLGLLVPRINIGGWFVIVNLWATQKLMREFQARIASR